MKEEEGRSFMNSSEATNEERRLSSYLITHFITREKL